MRKTVSGIKEIAKRAGVHPSTVSRVLNPQTRTLVSAQVAAKILKYCRVGLPTGAIPWPSASRPTDPSRSESSFRT